MTPKLQPLAKLEVDEILSIAVELYVLNDKFDTKEEILNDLTSLISVNANPENYKLDLCRALKEKLIKFKFEKDLEIRKTQRAHSTLVDEISRLKDISTIPIEKLADWD